MASCEQDSVALITSYLSTDKNDESRIKTWKKFLIEQNIRSNETWCFQDKKFEFIASKVAGVSNQTSSVEKKNLLLKPLQRLPQRQKDGKLDKLLQNLSNSNDLQRLSNENMK